MTNGGFNDHRPPAGRDEERGRADLAMQVRALRRWLVGVVVLLTFLAGGVLGGAVLWWHQSRQPGAPLGLVRAIQVHGDPAGRRAFRTAVVEGRRAARPQVRELQAARAALADLLSQPSLTAEAVQAGLARLRQADSTLRESLEPRVAQVLADLPLDRRQAIAGAMMPPARRATPAEE